MINTIFIISKFGKYAEKQDVTITQILFIYVVFQVFKDIKMSWYDKTLVTSPWYNIFFCNTGEEYKLKHRKKCKSLGLLNNWSLYFRKKNILSALEVQKTTVKELLSGGFWASKRKKISKALEWWFLTEIPQNIDNTYLKKWPGC